MGATNHSFTLLASAARTASLTTTPPSPNQDGKGVILTYDVTVVSGTSPTLQPNVRIKYEDAAFAVLWTAAANITATGKYNYVLYPGASGGNATEVDGIPLPLEWDLRDVIGGTSPSFTYSVRAHYIS